MPTLTEEEVFTFDQLSDEAKDKAREWMRDCEMQDFDTEFVFEDFGRAAGILGIELNQTQRGELDIRYRGFCSHGDGASFVGSYSHAPQSPAKIRAEFPEETRLHAIADGLDALQNGYKLLSGHRISVTIFQSGNYCHEMTMSVDEILDSETGERIEDFEIEKHALELMRDFARWIYKELEQEYDYRMSDECIDESLDQYEFDEDGDPAN
jgi:hypothetical protein